MKMRNNRKIGVLDLNVRRYSMETLKENIYATGLLSILKTQIIDEIFAVNYILNNSFQIAEEDEKITINDVLELQPQLNKDLLLKLYLIGPTDFDFPNFETYSNK